MQTIETTSIWKRTLAGQSQTDDSVDEHAVPREQLRAAFREFRTRAAHIAGQIDASLRDLTVHDISHIDALWEIADQLVDDEFPLNPLEAFILGGSFLLHDLGLALAAYPKGLAELQAEPYWKDSVARQLRHSLGRPPSHKEIDEPSKAVVEQATMDALRRLHAERAKNLGTMAFQDTAHDPEYFLIDNSGLRSTYGDLIGRIAWSHWENLDEVAQIFDKTTGAYPGFPNNWTIDQLKIACLLRVCDACHVDARRAPAFLAALKKPRGVAGLHWRFQSFIQMPFVKHGRMHFTSTKPFPIEDREAWWLGYDLLQQADRELSEVDSLLNGTSRASLKAHGVANIQSPQRLSKDLETAGWTPVDTSIRITDVKKLVRTLGGEHLYGRNASVPIRELIQNARDAVVARRLHESHEDDWGSIRVRVVHEEDHDWLEVEDSGLGMSEGVLCGPLIDFGDSYWDSDRMDEEWPGLRAAGFEPVGKYGIGFFSVFTIGDYVKITTRRQEDRKSETRVLEFEKGLDSRPILREASTVEQRDEPGTLVRVLLNAKPTERDGILGPMNFDEGPFDRVQRNENWDIKELCEWLCPALDVDLFVSHEGAEELAVEANDWRALEPHRLVERTILDLDVKDRILNSERIKTFLEHILPVCDARGQIIGRACLWPFHDFQHTSSSSSDFTQELVAWDVKGIVTSGQFRSGHNRHVLGLWIGTPEVAARNDARPIAADCPLQLIDWATEQAKLLAKRDLDLMVATDAAVMIRSVGADTGTLPIAISETGVVDSATLREFKDFGPKVVVFPVRSRFDRVWLGGPDHRQILRPDRRVVPNAIGVLSARMRGGFLKGPWPKEDPMERSSHPVWTRFWMSLWGATMEAVATSWGVSLDEMLAISDISSKAESFSATVGIDDQGKEIRHEEVDILRKPD